MIYTFWDYMRGAFSRNAGLRIDHLLLSPELAPRLKAAGVDREVRAMEKTSDHAPTWIELEVGEAVRHQKQCSCNGRLPCANDPRALRGGCYDFRLTTNGREVELTGAN